MSAEPTPGYLVWRLSMKWRVAMDRAVAPLGLTHAQYVVLASLSEGMADVHAAGMKIVWLGLLAIVVAIITATLTEELRS